MTKSSLDELSRKYRGLFPGRTGIDLVYIRGGQEVVVAAEELKNSKIGHFFLKDLWDRPVPVRCHFCCADILTPDESRFIFLS